MSEVLRYGISLVDQMSRPAKQAASAMDVLAANCAKAESHLARMQAQQRRSASISDVAGFSDIATHRHYAGASNAAMRQVFALNQQLEATPAVAEQAAVGLTGLAGPLAAGAAAAALYVGGAYALSAGLTSLAFSAAELALQESATTRRTTELFEALGKAPGSGAKTFSMISNLSRQLPQTRPALTEWATTLEGMGVSLAALRGQLVATAAAQALAPKGGAEAYLELTRRIQEAVQAGKGLKIGERQLMAFSRTGITTSEIAAELGVSVKSLEAGLKAGTVRAGAFGNALEKALIRKGKGPLQSALLDMNVQAEKAQDFFRQMFDGVKAGGFLAQMHRLLGIFDQNTVAGKAMKMTITNALNGMFNAAEKIVPVVRHMFMRMAIGALNTYIAIKPLVKYFGLFSETGRLDRLNKVLGNTADIIWSMAAGAASVAGSMGRIASVLETENKASGGLSGSLLATGMANGITAGHGEVITASIDLAQAAWKAMSGTLQIHSPSRLTMRLGAHVGDGLAIGMHSRATAAYHAGGRLGASAMVGTHAGIGAAGQVTESVRSAVPDIQPGAYAKAASAAPDRAAAAGRTLVVHVGGIHVAGGTGSSVMEITEEAVATMFERLALTQGL